MSARLRSSVVFYIRGGNLAEHYFSRVCPESVLILLAFMPLYFFYQAFPTVKERAQKSRLPGILAGAAQQLHRPVHAGKRVFCPPAPVFVVLGKFFQGFQTTRFCRLRPKLSGLRVP